MAARPLLVADDIGNQSAAGKNRSAAIRDIALQTAKGLKAGIELLYVEDRRAYPAAELGSFRFLAWHARHEERLAELCGAMPVPASFSLLSGSPAEQILATLHTRPVPELVVVGTRGSTGLKRLLIGSVAEEVVRHSRRPVMVIGPAVREPTDLSPGRKQKKILVPTDLERNSRPAERYALSLAKRLGARVTLFHCLWDRIHAVLVNTAYSGMAAYSLDTLLAEYRDEAAAIMKKKAAFFRKHGVPCTFLMKEEAVTSPCAVHQEAREGYLFVVMGTHGRSALLSAFFGSTAREAILSASVPVIVVHPGA